MEREMRHQFCDFAVKRATNDFIKVCFFGLLLIICIAFGIYGGIHFFNRHTIIWCAVSFIGVGVNACIFFYAFIPTFHYAFRHRKLILFGLKQKTTWDLM